MPSMRRIIKNTCKGVTIMEMVIALTVITIISGAALSIILSSIKVESRSAQIVEVTNLVESSIECFQYSDNENEYLELLKKIDANFSMIEKAEYNEENDEVLEEEIDVVYVLIDGIKIIRIKYDKEGNKIEIDAYLDGELIYKNVKYKKGQKDV